VVIDRDAAGHGWFVDATPGDDKEFVGGTASRGRSLTALDPRAVDRVDLLSVVAHELGHVAGLEDLGVPDDVMGELLAPGVRRV
jgi:hypothetical protein